MIIAVFLASISQILLKKSALQERTGLAVYMNKEVIGGYGIFASTVLITIIAYRNLPYKYGPIIESLSYVVVILLSSIFLSEKITLKKLIGCGCILLGIIIYHQ